MSAKIGPRDIEILTAIDRCPLTPRQLCRLSETFENPFHDENNLRRRLRVLCTVGLLNCWPYAVATDGRSPSYFRLTRDGYRLLWGDNASLPKRRSFEAISVGRHPHTFALAETIVQLAINAHRHGHYIERFARENSVRLDAEPFTVYPDAAFVIRRRDGRTFPFCLELDNGSERIQSKQDVESIERKLRGYDAHQSQFGKFDSNRYLVLFVTTKSHRRLDHILQHASKVMTEPQRTVFIGCDLEKLMASDPFADAMFEDHRNLKRQLIPKLDSDLKDKEFANRPSAVIA